MKCRFCQEEAFRDLDIGVEKIRFCHLHAAIYAAQAWFNTPGMSQSDKWKSAEDLLHIVTLSAEVRSRRKEQLDSTIALSDSPQELIKRLKEKEKPDE